MSAVFICIGIGAGLEILQNTLLDFIAIRGVQPDLVLIVATYTAFRFGSQSGQIAGFLMGIVEDAVAVTPFGFHSLVRLVHSYIIGLANGSVALDLVVVPMVLTFAAMVIKILVIAAVMAIFSLENVVNPVWTVATLVEAAYTIGLSPFIFLLLQQVPTRNG